MSLAIWGDDEHFLIGDEDCKEGDPIIIVAMTQDNILEWIKMLTLILEDTDIKDLPGEMGKCSNVA